ncbi:MAG: TonB-dependent receptor [Alphaproteobacteria bacterium]|nr:MAG: TonB-dependent receptor [Alphaproteobacteria bacterium]
MRLRPIVVLTVFFASGASALAEDAGPVEILVHEPRLERSPGQAAFATTILDEQDLATATAPRLDDLLKSVPGVNLFRRTSSRVAHPTIQGISLRGIGPNGAGRALVLLDGVPQNDPFGGWVYWSALPTMSLADVEVVRGGGAGTWGNAALVGTLILTSRAVDGTGARFEGSYGSRDTVSVTGDVQLDLGQVAVFAGGHHFSSDGFHTLGQDQRGPVDEPLASDATAGRAGVRWQLDEITTATLKLSVFKENRENGTPSAFNETRSYDLSLRVVREDATGDGFEVTLYGTDRRFENQFAAVAENRASDSPVLFQFDVPSSAFGATVLVRQSMDFGGVLETGVDLRRLEGETNERFFRSGNRFLRERNAGGEQVMAGGFVNYTTQPLPAVRLTGGVRLDYLRNADGARSERDLDTGVALRDEVFENRDHWVVNGRLGAVYDANAMVRIRGAAYSGFRLPTINEFYRPFRVRNDITEANPALEPERLWGVEAGIRAEPAAALSMELTAFANWLEDGVANVLVTDQPGFNAELGVFVPAGGSLSQRRSLDRVRALGLEASLVWAPDPAWTMAAHYLLSDPEVTRAADQPALVGKRPPLTARHQGSVSLTWRPDDRFTARTTVYGASRQFDDGLNSRRIDGYMTADLFLGYRISPTAQVQTRVENLFDTEIETGNGSDGLISLGRPRLISIGFRSEF